MKNCAELTHSAGSHVHSVLLWALAFSVDTSGKTWKMVFFSGDTELIWDSCLHHLPTLVVGM